MKTRAFLVTILGALGAASSRDARAAGTALDVQSARGTGMAAATTAMIDDSAAIYYNPAGIAQGRGLDAQVGVTPIVPSFRYTSPAGNETSLPFYVVPPINAYVSGGVTDALAIGIGVFTPYGLTVKWPSDWEGRRLITQSSLATYYVNPTVAYRIGPVRIGAGLQIVRATVDLQKKIAFGDVEGSTELGGGTWGVGANVGVQVEAIERYLSFGIHYRSAVKLDFDGHAHFDGVPPSLAGTIHDQAVKTSITQPDTLAIGVATRPTRALVFDADVVWYGWGKFHSVDIAFPDDASHSLSSTQPKNWKNGVNYHLGGEWRIDRHWQVRAGVLYDPTPSPEDTLTPDIPDASRLNVAVGGTYAHASGVRVELGLQHLFLFDATSTAPQLPGTYGGSVNIVGFSIGYAWHAAGEVLPVEPPPSPPPPALPPVTTPAEPQTAPPAPPPAQ